MLAFVQVIDARHFHLGASPEIVAPESPWNRLSDSNTWWLLRNGSRLLFSSLRDIAYYVLG